jgi:predicted RNase H-like HicB family nuclease
MMPTPRAPIGTIGYIWKSLFAFRSKELPEGIYLATSDELPGPVAQGRTVSESLDIARDVARKLIEARRERKGEIPFPTASNRRDYTIVAAA